MDFRVLAPIDLATRPQGIDHLWDDATMVVITDRNPLQPLNFYLSPSSNQSTYVGPGDSRFLRR
jgi:hypothetical protein